MKSLYALMSWLLMLNSLLVDVYAVPGSTPTQYQESLISVTPLAAGVRADNCYPFGSTAGGFAGFTYKSIAGFNLYPGDTISFDSGKQNTNLAGTILVPICRSIYFSTTSVDSTCVTTSLSRKDFNFTKWSQVANLQCVGSGDTIIGNYDLTFTLDSSYSFPGGILSIGVSSIGTADDTECDTVGVTTNCNDGSGKFLNRFYSIADSVYGAPPLSVLKSQTDHEKIAPFIITKLYVCPANSKGAPFCICNTGYAGSLEFSTVTNQYVGTCILVVCPQFAKPTLINGTASCTCNSGYNGVIKFNDCQTIGCNSGVDVGVYAPTSTCSIIACPANSNNHPDCFCNQGFVGSLSFSFVTRIWSGICSASLCPINAKAGPALINGEAFCRCNQGFSNTVPFSFASCVGSVCSAGGVWAGACTVTACPFGSKENVVANGVASCTCNSGFNSFVFAKLLPYIDDVVGPNDSNGVYHSSAICSVECPANAFVDDSNFVSNGVMSCVCNKGYTGSLLFSRDLNQWNGMCTVVACNSQAHAVTEFSSGAPSCACNSGFKGTLTIASCTSNICTSTYSGECTIITCPTFAVSLPIVNGEASCSCSSGYMGSLSYVPCLGPTCNSEGFYLGSCDLVACPANAYGTVQKSCTCNDGFNGAISFSPCTTMACNDNMEGFYTGTCSTVSLPSNARFASGSPMDLGICNSGYAGSISFNQGLSGSATSSYVGTCQKVICLANSFSVTYNETAACICNRGYTGSLSFQPCTSPSCEPLPSSTCMEGSYIGTCNAQSCPLNSFALAVVSGVASCTCNVGYKTSIGAGIISLPFIACSEPNCADKGIYTATCDFVSCPAHSTSMMVDGKRTCGCNVGFAGAPLWEAASQSFLGSCNIVDCPANAYSDSPAFGCKCYVGFKGAVSNNPVWESVTQTYIGICNLVPLPTNALSCNNIGACVCNEGYMGFPASVQNNGIDTPFPMWATLSQSYEGSCTLDYRLLDCPQFSHKVAVHDATGNLLIDATQCDCDVGFFGTVVPTPNIPYFTSTCARAQCLVNSVHVSIVPGLGDDCLCLEGFQGIITRTSVSPYYTGSCVYNNCPANSAGLTSGCICNAGYLGTITTTAATQLHDGHCTTQLIEEGGTFNEFALMGLVHEEYSRATAAEKAIYDIFIAKTTQSTIDRQAINASLALEIKRAIASENGLLKLIQAENSRAVVAETALITIIDAKEMANEASHQILATAIGLEQSRAIVVENDISGLMNKLNLDLVSEVSRAEANQRAIQVALSNEAGRATLVETSLSKKIANETTRATFAEEVEHKRALKAEDDINVQISILEDIIAVNTTHINGQISALIAKSRFEENVINSMLGQEVSRAMSATNKIETNLGIESLRAQQQLETETSRAVSAEQVESSRAMVAESVLRTDLASEMQRAQTAEGLIFTEYTSLNAAFNESLVQEISRARAVESNLTQMLTMAKNAISNEVSRATTSESSISASFNQAVSTETARAMGTEGSLNASIFKESVLQASIAEYLIKRPSVLIGRKEWQITTGQTVCTACAIISSTVCATVDSILFNSLDYKVFLFQVHPTLFTESPTSKNYNFSGIALLTYEDATQLGCLNISITQAKKIMTSKREYRRANQPLVQSITSVLAGYNTSDITYVQTSTTSSPTSSPAASGTESACETPPVWIALIIINLVVSTILIVAVVKYLRK